MAPPDPRARVQGQGEPRHPGPPLHIGISSGIELISMKDPVGKVVDWDEQLRIHHP